MKLVSTSDLCRSTLILKYDSEWEIREMLISSLVEAGAFILSAYISLGL